MLVSVKKQRQKIWIDEETQPEDEVEIALDFVGSPYENQGLSPLGASAHKEREECVPTQASFQNPSQDQAKTQFLKSEAYNEGPSGLGAGQTHEVAEGNESFMAPPHAGACGFVDRGEEPSQVTQAQKAKMQVTKVQETGIQAVGTHVSEEQIAGAQGSRAHEQEPLALEPKGGKGRKAQRNWRWALFSVLVHVACVVALYAFAQAVLQGKFSFVFDGHTPVAEEKGTRAEPLQTLESDGEGSESTQVTPATPAGNKPSRPFVHMIDLEDVVPSQK